jgi:hypothetical protein
LNRGQRKVIEQALFFAIGFLAATLSGLGAIPIILRRSMRLAEASARPRTPFTQMQAIAERDALRAQNAVEQAGLERRSFLAEEAAALLRSEIGLLSISLIGREADAMEDSRYIYDLRAELCQLDVERRHLESDLASSQLALHDLSVQRDRANAAKFVATSRQDELEAAASRDRATIAILTARAESLEGRLEDTSCSTRVAAEKSHAVRLQLSEHTREEDAS